MIVCVFVENFSTEPSSSRGGGFGRQGLRAAAGHSSRSSAPDHSHGHRNGAVRDENPQPNPRRFADVVTVSDDDMVGCILFIFLLTLYFV